MAENEEEVTPEQTDLIVQYSQITGHEDLDKCKDHLKVKYSLFLTPTPYLCESAQKNSESAISLQRNKITSNFLDMALPDEILQLYFEK